MTGRPRLHLRLGVARRYTHLVIEESHLLAAALGFPMSDEIRLGERAIELAREEAPEPLADGGELRTWRDPSRAGLAIYTSAEGHVRSVIPFLDGARELRVRISELVEAGDPVDSALIVDVLGPGDQATARLGFVAQDFHVNRERLQQQVPMDAALTAFARRFVVRAPHAPSQLEELGDAPTRFVATGLVAAQQGRSDFSPARALVRAQIEDCEQRINRSSRETFQRARVVCEAMEFDVVARYQENHHGQVFRPGQVLEGSVFFVATLDPAHHDYTMPLIRPRR